VSVLCVSCWCWLQRSPRGFSSAFGFVVSSASTRGRRKVHALASERRSVSTAQRVLRGNGQGVPLVYTPGGRHDIEVARPLAQKLARRYRVILWEHANTGRSDVVYAGARDVDLWSDQLAEFLRILGVRPAYLAGRHSAVGYRTSRPYAIRRWCAGCFCISSAQVMESAERLAKAYYGDLVRLPKTGNGSRHQRRLPGRTGRGQSGQSRSVPGDRSS